MLASVLAAGEAACAAVVAGRTSGHMQPVGAASGARSPAWELLLPPGFAEKLVAASALLAELRHTALCGQVAQPVVETPRSRRLARAQKPEGKEGDFPGCSSGTEIKRKQMLLTLSPSTIPCDNT